jgi:hypothetical protein
MMIPIFVSLYILTGLQLGKSMPGLIGDNPQWHTSWLVCLGWPCFVVAAVAGLIVEGITTVYNRVKPKEDKSNGNHA